jgi:hypothetical protein
MSWGICGPTGFVCGFSAGLGEAEGLGMGCDDF